MNVMNAFASRAVALALSAACLPLFLMARIRAQQSSSPASRPPSAESPARANRAKPGQGDIERGKYLVEQVALCGECHTPRDADGTLDDAQWLQGATIWIKPVHTTLDWAEWAPRLAGLPSFTDDQAEQILEQGTGPNGAPLRPPMHIYHLNHADALAIIAYLRSLSKPPDARTSPESVSRTPLCRNGLLAHRNIR